MREADTAHLPDVVAEQLGHVAVEAAFVGVPHELQQLGELCRLGAVHARVDHERLAVGPTHHEDEVAQHAARRGLARVDEKLDGDRAIRLGGQRAQLGRAGQRRRDAADLPMRRHQKDREAEQQEARDGDHDPDEHAHPVSSRRRPSTGSSTSRRRPHANTSKSLRE